MSYRFNLLIVALFFLLNQSSKGQAHINWEWQKVTDISYQDIEFKNNFIYAVGNFSSSSVVVGASTYLNAGGSDIIVCKMDTLGNIIWSVHLGGSNNESLSSICVDNNDNILVTGTMVGSLNVGTTALNSIGGSDILIIKFDPSGNVVFAKNVGTIGNDNGRDITTDYNNDVYVVGNKSTGNMSFASTNNTYGNAILKWSSNGTEVYMHYMREGLIGQPAGVSAYLIKYSEYDSTIIISGSLVSGSSSTSPYSISHSSNINLYIYTTASASWGPVHMSYLCKTSVNGIAEKLIGYGSSYSSSIYDLTTNPLNGDFYFSTRAHFPLSQNDYNNWIKGDTSFTNLTSLPINLSSNDFPSSGHNGVPLKLNYFNNSIYGLLYQQVLNSNSVCSDFYAASLNLSTNVSELKNLDYGQTYLSGIGFNGTYCMGTTKIISKSCQANCVLPSYSLNPAPDVSFCSNSGATIGFPECYYVKGGTLPYTFSWQPAIGLSATNIPQPYVSGLTSNTTYTLTVTDSANNVLYDTINVVLNPNPIITYSYSPSPFCSGDTVAVSLNGGSYYYPNPYSPGNYLSNPILLTPTKDTSFEVLGYSSSGCMGFKLVSLEKFKINAHCIAPIVCTDSNTTLIASSASSFMWQPGNFVGDSVLVPITSSTVFTVTGTDASGCTATATTAVFSSSSISVNTSSSEICLNDSVQLTASGIGYVTGPQSLPLGYCYPPPTNNGDWSASINNFRFNDLVNNGNGVQLNGYADFTSLPFTTVKKGVTYSFQLERLSSYGVKYAIWIDYDRNGSFAGSNELVFSTNLSTGTNLVTQGTVTIPLASSSGLTRMRVLCMSLYASSSYMPCLAINSPFGVGEYEDYTINIISTSPLVNFSWSPTSVSGLGGTVMAYPINSTVYTVTSTDFQNCTLADTVSVHVNTPSFSNTNLNVCSNQLPYVWNGQSLISTGNYSFLTSNSHGCDSTASLVFTINDTSSSTSNISVCSNQLPYIWNGQSLTSIGNYSFITTNSNGCDSTAYLVFTVNNNSSSTMNISVCSNQLPYIWNGQSLISTGNYSFLTTNSNGCDSTAYLVFTVNNNSSSTANISVCSNQLPYVWNGQSLTSTGNYTFLTSNSNGCDSIAFLVFTVNDTSSSITNISVCSNQLPFVWNGQSLTSTGNYSFLTSNSNGCDSTSFLVFTSNPLPAPIITWSGNDLITQPYYTSYQWFLNNIYITGANDSIYSPSAWGDYFVQVSDSNGCVNSSSILNYYPLNANATLFKSIQVFPNPTHAFFTINFPTNQPYKLMLTDMSGKKVFEKVTDGRSISETISIGHLAEGVYNLKVIGNQVYNVKIIRY